jgi:hypothetical protein
MEQGSPRGRTGQLQPDPDRPPRTSEWIAESARPPLPAQPGVVKGRRNGVGVLAGPRHFAAVQPAEIVPGGTDDGWR